MTTTDDLLDIPAFLRRQGQPKFRNVSDRKNFVTPTPAKSRLWTIYDWSLYRGDPSEYHGSDGAVLGRVRAKTAAEACRKARKKWRIGSTVRLTAE